MPIVVSGHLATAIFNVAERRQASPQPATGRHAELLEEISQRANALIRLVELERSGVCDGAGFWVGSDPILNTAQKLVTLAEQRVGERR